MAADDTVDTYMEMQNRRNASKAARFYVDLQPGEATVAQMASRIYAARLGSGSVATGEEEAAMRQAVTEALRIVQYVEHWVDDAAEDKSRT